MGRRDRNPPPEFGGYVDWALYRLSGMQGVAEVGEQESVFCRDHWRAEATGIFHHPTPE